MDQIIFTDQVLYNISQQLLLSNQKISLVIRVRGHDEIRTMKCKKGNNDDTGKAEQGRRNVSVNKCTLNFLQKNKKTYGPVREKKYGPLTWK